MNSASQARRRSATGTVYEDLNYVTFLVVDVPLACSHQAGSLAAHCFSLLIWTCHHMKVVVMRGMHGGGGGA